MTEEELDRVNTTLTGDWVSCRKMPFSKLIGEAMDNGSTSTFAMAYAEFTLLMKGCRSPEAFGAQIFELMKDHIEIEVDLEIKEILRDEKG